MCVSGTWARRPPPHGMVPPGDTESLYFLRKYNDS